MRVLVTGHDGYIGSVLVPLFQSAGHDVTGLDTHLFSDCVFGTDSAAPTREIRKDVRDLEPADLLGFDAVVHLAGISNDPLGDLRPECTYDVNWRGTLAAAAAAKAAGVERFLFSSSCSIYGASAAARETALLNETADFHPVTPYGESKMLAEGDLHALADDDFSPTYLRNATAYGVSPRLRGDLVVNNLTGFAATTGQVLMKSDGMPWRPLVHVEDIARAFLALAEAPREVVHDRAFNVGRTEENYRVREVAEIVGGVVPGSVVSFADGASADRRDYRVDCDLIRREVPGFRPVWTVRAGVEELYEAYRRHGLTLESLTGAHLIRLEQIKSLQRQGRLDDDLRICAPPAEATHRGRALTPGKKTDVDRLAPAAEATPPCRSCGTGPLRPFLALGKTPLADALVPARRAAEQDPTYPLDVAFCEACSLVQILEEVPADVLFGADYPYFSSFSESLLEHSRRHVDTLVRSRGLGPNSLVVEIASNDGYLLRNVVAAGVRALGIEPAPGPAAACRAAGVPTLEEFFGLQTARRLVAEGYRADVLVANNVMAHVPDLNGFVAGMALLLADDGLVTVENPYVRDLIDHCEFDTIYHEHFCYYSCTSVDALARRHGLALNDVEYFPDLHGGTLRWHLGKTDRPSQAVLDHLADERRRGLTAFGYYADFARRVEQVKTDLLALLRSLRAGGATVAAYGAAAKGSTLLNCVGIDGSLVDFVVDRNVHKQGRLMPGVHLEILPPEALLERRPDYTLILAWNFAAEIIGQQAEYRAAGGRFVVPIPVPKVLA